MLKQLSKRAQSSPNIITNVQRSKAPVDKQSLESYFEAFSLFFAELELEERHLCDRTS